MRRSIFVAALLCVSQMALGSAATGDIEYLPANDQGTKAFNHAATEIFLHGAGLLDGIGIAEDKLAKAPSGPFSNALSQLLATFYTFGGRYDMARQRYLSTSHPTAVTDAIKGGSSPQFVKASDAIARLAQGRKAVFLNENHGEPITRALILELLPELRAQGYTYLALETLNRSDGGIGATTNDHCLYLKDGGLCSRGYALDDVKTGIYSHEPIYGEVIKLALSLGFRLVAYDIDNAADDTARDKGQAVNLSHVFRDDSKARLVLLGGFDHIAKEDSNMAEVFRAMSGIDPLSIDQVDLLGVDPSLWGRYKDEALRYDASIVFMDGRPLSTRPSAMDATVYRPSYAANRADASWLALDGRRQKVAVGHFCRSFPCLLTARRRQEPDGTPADRLYLEQPAEQIMYLAPGDYQLTIDTKGQHKVTGLTVGSAEKG